MLYIQKEEDVTTDDDDQEEFWDWAQEIGILLKRTVLWHGTNAKL